MTGFPGESETEFAESVAFTQALPFTYLHVFTYSERPGTPAAISEQMPVRLRKDRNRVLRELAARKNLEFRKSMIGSSLSVVTLDKGSLSSNFLKVELASARPANQLIDVNIGRVTEAGLKEFDPLQVL